MTSPVAWPVALQGAVLTIADSSTTFGRNVASFKPDVGRAIERARTTVVDDELQIGGLMNEAEAGVLEAFYKVTTLQGTTPFTMVDPESGTVKTFQFTAAPQFVFLGAGYRRTVLQLLRLGT